MRKSKFSIILLFCAVSIWGFYSCSAIEMSKKQIRVSGSDTMFDITQLLAKEYMEKHPDITISVSGGGSGKGIAGLIEGDVDIAMASRTITPNEIKKLAEETKSVGLSFLIAKDAISIYTHKSNPVRELSIEQLRKIFSGEITNWNQCGGDDKEISIILRASDSGTYEYFRQHILEGGEYKTEAVTAESAMELMTVLTNTPNGIAFGGIGYEHFKDVYVNTIAINGIHPNEKNILQETYPITRYLYFYTVRLPEGVIKNFMDWILSSEGQNIISESGYIPLWSFPEQ